MPNMALPEVSVPKDGDLQGEKREKVTTKEENIATLKSNESGSANKFY